MEIKIFTVCDFAQDNVGKLTIVGIFDSIFSARIPFNYDSFSIACRVHLTEEEKKNNQHLQLKFMQEDGANYAQDIDINFTPTLQTDTYNIVVNMRGVLFGKAGKYCVQLLKEDDAIAKTFFIVEANNSI